MLIRLSRDGVDAEALGTEVARALLEGGAAAIDGFATGFGVAPGPGPAP